jgi:uncharacterized lipoprotein YbaY
MKTATVLVLALASLALLAGCPDNSPKPGATPSASSATPAPSGAASAATDKGGSGW